jgi:hypothetical protein
MVFFTSDIGAICANSPTEMANVPRVNITFFIVSFFVHAKLPKSLPKASRDQKSNINALNFS